MKLHCLKAHTLLLTSTAGDVSISGIFTTVDIDGANPQFTLTCISYGGPATTVSWTRDSTTVSEGNETMLLNPITAEYLHTLKVTGDVKGRYTCTVANNKPSRASATMECEVARNHHRCSLHSRIGEDRVFSQGSRERRQYFPQTLAS